MTTYGRTCSSVGGTGPHPATTTHEPRRWAIAAASLCPRGPGLAEDVREPVTCFVAFAGAAV